VENVPVVGVYDVLPKTALRLSMRAQAPVFETIDEAVLRSGAGYAVIGDVPDVAAAVVAAHSAGLVVIIAVRASPSPVPACLTGAGSRARWWAGCLPHCACGTSLSQPPRYALARVPALSAVLTVGRRFHRASCAPCARARARGSSRSAPCRP
jgi:hypothetical protein